MSLDYKPTLTPEARKKATKAKQAVREPKRIQVKKRLLGKWHTHPVDKMVRIANFLEASNPELAAKIWIRLLDSCELEENKKRFSAPPIPVSEMSSPEQDLQALEKLEADGNIRKTESDTERMAVGEIVIQTQTSSETDLPGHTEQ